MRCDARVLRLLVPLVALQLVFAVRWVFIATTSARAADALDSTEEPASATPMPPPPPAVTASAERLCIVVPFRDGCTANHANSGFERETNLLLFRAFMARHLAVVSPGLDYYIVVAEQAQREAFNRGFLFNHGFKFGLDELACHYFAFHDVDQVPLSLANTYANYAQRVGAPVHMSSNMSMNFFCPMNNQTMGGVVMFTPAMYESINGFSNVFYGWGREDDNALDRIRACFGDPFRLNFTAGAYMSLSHPPIGIQTPKLAALYDKEAVFQHQRKNLTRGARGRMGVSADEAKRLGIPPAQLDGLRDLVSRTFGAPVVTESATRYVRFVVEVVARNGSRAPPCPATVVEPSYAAWVHKTRVNSVANYVYRFVPA